MSICFQKKKICTSVYKTCESTLYPVTILLSKERSSFFFFRNVLGWLGFFFLYRIKLQDNSLKCRDYFTIHSIEEFV